MKISQQVEKEEIGGGFMWVIYLNKQNKKTGTSPDKPDPLAALKNRKKTGAGSPRLASEEAPLGWKFFIDFY